MTLQRGESKRRSRGAASARRAAADGSGLRWPGAADRFALLAEVLFTGLIVAIVSLGIVTIPLALAVGVRHLRRFVLAEATGLALVWADVRAGFVRVLPVGAGVALAGLVLGADLVLISSGVLPGGVAVAVVCTALLAAIAVVVLVAATDWEPGARWGALVRSAARRSVRDVRGSALLAGGLLMTVVSAWQLAPLVVPALGCLVFAALAVRLSHEARTR
jgi:hypothetical protein